MARNKDPLFFYGSIGSKVKHWQGSTISYPFHGDQEQRNCQWSNWRRMHLIYIIIHHHRQTIQTVRGVTSRHGYLIAYLTSQDPPKNTEFASLYPKMLAKWKYVSLMERIQGSRAKKPAYVQSHLKSYRTVAKNTNRQHFRNNQVEITTTK